MDLATRYRVFLGIRDVERRADPLDGQVVELSRGNVGGEPSR